jgi:hypothetical protein
LLWRALDVSAKLTNDAKEAQDTSHDEAVPDFLSGKDRYHGADFDRVSGSRYSGNIFTRLKA